jgi:LmbE family N-acetylglucosaminyl deacetylase/glycosyltransferase involved in cell wall biosynthesis
MHVEAEAIPYEAARLRAERLLVLAPHPDDEVIGCGGLVAQHLREGRVVHIAVVTDGAEANTNAADREEESRRGVARLGDGATLEFLGFPDRGLDDSVAPRLRELLLDVRPDLIAVPSPIEIHPDHLALARAFIGLVQRDETLFADLAATKVAFYEVSQPIRPNTLVDISDVADSKYAGIAEHRSQTSIRDYAAFARGLNAYRAMTLPPETQFAEAYHVMELAALRTTALSELQRTMSAHRVDVARETLPISVVIRTKDRPALLREALDSVRATGYPCEIVVVNDGGAKPDVGDAKLVHHEESRGRAIAANEGVRAASNAYVAFLDDDDLFYPEHLATLATAAQSSSHAAWYTDAVSAFMRPAESGAYATESRLRLFAQDFDRELLLVDNFIPLPALLMPRESILDAGGFDPDFDLFEDWDLLIRLAQRGSFLRIPTVTVEVRHFHGSDSIVLASHEGTQHFRDAKLKVWKKHAALIDHDLFANVFERQKKRTGELYSSLVESKGQAGAMRTDEARLQRDKRELIAQIQELHENGNRHIVRIRELEGVVQVLNETCMQLEAVIERATAVSREADELRHANATTHAALQSARVEIDRLNGLLAMIFGSRTWKLHTLVERLKGRG